MSEQIRKYKHSEKWFKDSEDLTLTALVGGEEHGHSIQFTVGCGFIVLSESQLKDLIMVIAQRINCRKGFTATGHTDLRTVLPNGQIIIEEES